MSDEDRKDAMDGYKMHLELQKLGIENEELRNKLFKRDKCVICCEMGTAGKLFNYHTFLCVKHVNEWDELMLESQVWRDYITARSAKDAVIASGNGTEAGTYALETHKLELKIREMARDFVSKK